MQNLKIMNRSSLLASSVLTVLLLVAVATSAFADTAGRKEAQRQVAEQLSDFKRTAFEMRREADALSVVTPSKRLHWQSHADKLSRLGGQVNNLGKNLANLESQKPNATEHQAMAIEQTRPHLVAVADNLTRAIQLVNENRNSIYGPEYAEAVNEIYSHVDALHDKLDTILDYDASRMRLERLNL
jgi:molecular chaperone GrpE (heat shock protein)